ncbi:RimJ/RimL family protein N-acetyltransferase [Metabacillus crassostreae]|uniref:GNAT family N-acetyltransferase n=1 Tax=Metabacillus crassostreae TaxID=929098 RepID=UPI00195736C2|nr:GNAT family N-acetyltransferase [Metabacillus crassostreae]MBM7606105.1 RimJ/RimL family protein N-acetyltransferase [Metabacillus crassostreae]
MTIKIRFSKKSDFEQLIDLDHKVWNMKATPTIIKWNSLNEFSEKNPEGSQLVAILEDRVVGYLGFHHPTPLKTNQHVLEIDIAVDQHYQGKGIGRKLLDELMKMAKDKNIHKLALRVLSSNEGAIDFYKKCGFTEQGRLVKEFLIDGEFVDDLLLYKLVE